MKRFSLLAMSGALLYASATIAQVDYSNPDLKQTTAVEHQHGEGNC
ncbi:MAG: hypothetical protein PUH24_07250 [Prevotellaceae bacterium]|nr:hypothetical protein [Prevotellaceae bacterium]MDY6130550.1 hypothetical protein [Prevotella sp.]